MSTEEYVPPVSVTPSERNGGDGGNSTDAPRRRRAAQGREAQRRAAWGAQWGKAGSDAGKAAREKD